ncbi:TetR/AcrR family transcriptional regulator [Actinomadura livida]|uniref:AcrR family transcriptional regulator n=1 Tax=Actinomadura livida TaxID=79909 RepID=A0A7W7IJW2_9ACTN|nr:MULTISPECIES: TetR/AcrR family transcriptional regulator [Actinomadura]MBB4778053.1 AcrR family transcriptional regulator [Actinomadura catellatispora]GGT96902.1 TetR family transcriptional regulator [Actinomadura livida]
MTKEPDGRDLNLSLKLLWGGRTRPQRGRPPTLSLGRIVAAAVEVADELSLTEGLEALSMRSIATHLGVGTMSLYRYVPGRSELLDLMLDHVIEVPETDPGDDHGWREILTDAAHHHWKLCMDHPWYPFVDQSRPLLGPNSMRGLDRLFRLLRPTGLDDRTLMMMIGVQGDYVDGLARGYINERRAERRTGVSNEDFWRAQEPTLVEAMNSGRFPTMAALSESTFDFTHEQLFEFGLARLHDGFATFIDRGARPS